MFMYEPWAVSVCVCEGQGRVMGENIYSWDLEKKGREVWMDGWRTSVWVRTRRGMVIGRVEVAGRNDLEEEEAEAEEGEVER